MSENSYNSNQIYNTENAMILLAGKDHMIKTLREPRVLDAREKLALLEQPNPKTPTGLRNLCLISLMLRTGLRVSEVINLQENQVNWDHCLLHIEASGGACERNIAVELSVINLLKSWMRIKPRKSHYVFTTLAGNQLKDRYIREMIKRLARKAGLKQDVYPHLLRLTFAVDFLRETRDPITLQKVLGHRGYSTTYNFIKLYLQKDLENSTTDELAKKMLITQKADKKNSQKISNSHQPLITILEEYNSDMARPIPAMKCCHCNFILHYRGDCPQCGTRFNDILKHWGKI